MRARLSQQPAAHLRDAFVGPSALAVDQVVRATFERGVEYDEYRDERLSLRSLARAEREHDAIADRLSLSHERKTA